MITKFCKFSAYADNCQCVVSVNADDQSATEGCCSLWIRSETVSVRYSGPVTDDVRLTSPSTNSPVNLNLYGSARIPLWRLTEQNGAIAVRPVEGILSDIVLDGRVDCSISSTYIIVNVSVLAG